MIVLVAMLILAAMGAVQTTGQSLPGVSDGLPMDNDGQIIILITTVAGIVTTILGFLVQLYRERRNRAWELEDRQATAEALRRETIMAAATLKTETAKTRDILMNKIEENTQINIDALKQANHVGDKLARIGALIDNVRTTKQIDKDQLDHVATVVEETKAVVDATKDDTDVILGKLGNNGL